MWNNERSERGGNFLKIDVERVETCLESLKTFFFVFTRKKGRISFILPHLHIIRFLRKVFFIITFYLNLWRGNFQLFIIQKVAFRKLLHLQKKVTNHCPSVQLKKICSGQWFGTFFGDRVKKSEKLSEIKQPLSRVKKTIVCKVYY